MLGENRAVAKQVLQSIVTLVEVTDETIRIVGDNEQLSHLVSDAGNDPEEGPEGGSKVRRYTPKACWRVEKSRRDTNGTLNVRKNVTT